jgi:uncharacterized protein YdeI (BOF family)
MTQSKTAFFVASALCLAGIPAAAQDAQDTRSQKSQVQQEQLTHPAGDREWVSLTGSVKSQKGDSFLLSYGGGEITVELDDPDWLNEAALVAGGRVTVTGKIDDDFYEQKSLEASSVYIDKLDVYYYASAADEEGGYFAYPLAKQAGESEWLGLTGSVAGSNDESITLDTGDENVEVSTDQLAQAPALQRGDRVIVYGEMDDADLFEGRQLVARSVVVLKQDQAK